MRWLISPLALAGGAMIVGFLFSVRDGDRRARQRWHETHAAAERSVEDHQRNIAQHLAATQSTYDFALLVDVHFSSMRIADSTYEILKDANISLQAIVRILDNISIAKAEIKRALAKKFDRDTKADILAELRAINEFKTQVLSDYYKVKEEKRALLGKVLKLNSDTHRLKYSIKDRCGPKGANWYFRLEQRKLLKRNSQPQRPNQTPV